MNYLNEIDPYAAQWLRNLIDAGHIPPAVVDTRSIVDVTPGDLAGFRQCHFFAGIGVWALALRRAGVPDDADLWTGSCPCQPFSTAGAGAGMDDERHLWPHFQWLISKRRPAVVLGEQVASKDANPWIDLVHTDMETLGYAFGCVAFPSAGVGAPHIRDRTYWVAHTGEQRLDGVDPRICGRGPQGHAGHDGATRRGGTSGPVAAASVLGGLADSECREPSKSEGQRDGPREANSPGATGGGAGCRPVLDPRSAGPTNGLWRDADWLLCRDGKWRPVEPGTFPLAHGAPARVGRLRADQERLAANVPRKDQGNRVGRLRGYGNAINVEAAQAFVEAALALSR